MAERLGELYELFSTDSRCLVPLGVRAEGVIFGLGLSSPADGSVGSEAEACLERMRMLVEAGGGSPDSIGRVTCYVRDADDREPVYSAWERLFPRPGDRPAFKVLTGPLPEPERVRMNVIAVPGAGRRRIDLPGVAARDPTVLIGDWLFTSRLHGISPDTGAQVDGPGPQLRQALANARSLIELSGRQDLELAQLTSFGLGETYRAAAETALSDAAGQSAATNVLQSWVRPGTEAMVEAIALNRQDGGDFQELYLAPLRSNQVCGIRFGRLVYAAGLEPVDPASGETPSGVEEQLRTALANMDRLLQAAGCGRGQVARVAFYMRDLEDRPVLNQVWEQWFPDPRDRPPHTYLPASLPEGRQVSVQVIALAGGERRVLAVPGVEHGDPMSLGAVVDNLLVSSRIFGGADSRRDDGAEEHTRKCFETAAALLDAGGGEWPDLKQLTVYASAPEYRGPVEQQLARLSPEARLQFLETDLGRRTLLPRLQLLALVE